MDIEALVQTGIDAFHDRSFREKASGMMDPNVVIVDSLTGQELYGPDDYVRYAEFFINAVPDLKVTVLEHKVSGSKASSRVRGQGNFTGTLETPMGRFRGKGNPLDIEYHIHQIFNEAGKVVRLVVNYDIQDFLRPPGG